MSEDYRSMWETLGLDLAAHDALLEALGKGYQDIYLAQKNRPEGMGYFDFVMSEVHGLRIKELLDEKAASRKVIGSFCVFVPEELILAEQFRSLGRRFYFYPGVQVLHNHQNSSTRSTGQDERVYSSNIEGMAYYLKTYRHSPAWAVGLYKVTAGLYYRFFHRFKLKYFVKDM